MRRLEKKKQMTKCKTEGSLAIEGDDVGEGQSAFAKIAAEVMASRTPADGESDGTPACCVARCPDQWVGAVRFEAGRFHCGPMGAASPDGFAWRRATDELSPEGPRRLLMILESPHIDEFGGDHQPIGPAAGATGRNIRALLYDVNVRGLQELGLSPNGEELDLVLINAIQRQTSLGHPPRRFRDSVFRRAWGCPSIGRADFQGRIAALWRADAKDIVMNCCTGAEASKTSLKRLVYDALRDLSDRNAALPPVVIACAHPCSWQRNKRNREARVIGHPARLASLGGGLHV
ncbi:hypothetical protein B0G82_3622 [Paraburkholderia sp. BL17N1]|nr:hypothetical protein B0G82_3622 [Paraburkholderia sp. BL17N1]